MRIAYWYGKVNQHTDAQGAWVSDPDGTSGANIDKLTYCKKWYPNTTKVESYKNETITTWRRNSAYEQSGYTNTVVTDKCIQGKDSLIRVITEPVVPGNVIEPNSQSVSTFKGNANANGLAKLWNILSSKTTFWFRYSTDSKNLTQLTSPVPMKDCSVNENSSLPCAPNLGVNNFSQDIGGFPYNTLYYVKACVGDAMTSNQIYDGAVPHFECGDIVSFMIKSTTPTSCPANGTPSVTIISPNGGETFVAGQSITVKWNSCNMPSSDNVTLYLQYTSAQGGWSNILLANSGTSYTSKNDGEEIVNILPESTISSIVGTEYGINFKIKIKAGYVGGVEIQDESDSAFTILPLTTECNSATPSITVLSPNGGEVYEAGQKITVKWKTCNIPEIKKVIIVLDPSSDTTNDGYNMSGSDGTVNDGSESFRLNPVMVGKYKIRVLYENVGASNTAVDSSDELFRIKALTIPRSPETDITNQNNQDRMATPPTVYIPSNRILRVGVRGDDVKSLQSYFGIKTDGVYGKGTAAKVKEWQREKGLKADGLFGKKSQLILFSEGEQ